MRRPCSCRSPAGSYRPQSCACGTMWRWETERTPYYRADLALIHHEGFAFHAEDCAPGILSLLESVRSHHGLVVELGCGSGLLTRQLVDAGHRVDRDRRLPADARHRTGVRRRRPGDPASDVARRPDPGCRCDRVGWSRRELPAGRGRDRACPRGDGGGAPSRRSARDRPVRPVVRRARGRPHPHVDGSRTTGPSSPSSPFLRPTASCGRWRPS